MDKQIVYLHTKEYCTAMQKQLMLLITISVNLTDLMLSPRSQTQKSTYCDFLIQSSEQAKLIYGHRISIVFTVLCCT